MKLTKFKEVDLTDPFFDSLKAGYGEFGDWFARKAEEPVYVSLRDDESLQGFLYLKLEIGTVDDVSPPLWQVVRAKPALAALADVLRPRFAEQHEATRIWPLEPLLPEPTVESCPTTEAPLLRLQ